MTTTNKILLGVLAVIVLLGMTMVGAYNKFTSGNEDINGKWAQVESQYQRRFDLIPNLVETVKGAMAQEKAIFLALAEARTRYAGASTPNERAAAASQTESALGRLLVVMENYPQLRSNEQVTNLMSQLEGTENRISVERMRYNQSVQGYNSMIKRIPDKWLASMFGFSPREYFQAEEGSEKAPKVQF